MRVTQRHNHYFGDVAALTGRSLKHTFRSADTIISVIAVPVMMMLMLVYVFGGAIQVGPGNYVDYMLPGIMIMGIAGGIAYTAARLNNDVTSGIFERFHAMPIARSALLWGHVLTSVLSCGASVAAIVAIALLMGFRAPFAPGAWLAAAGILLLFTLATTWLAVISGLTAKSVEGAGAFAYPLMFLPFISSAFVPTDTMPTVVRVFAENQPVTAIVEAVRRLLLGRPVEDFAWIALAWGAAILVVTYLCAMRVFRRRAA